LLEGRISKTFPREAQNTIFDINLIEEEPAAWPLFMRNHPIRLRKDMRQENQATQDLQIAE
jgi:hypothetical protein